MKGLCTVGHSIPPHSMKVPSAARLNHLFSAAWKPSTESGRCHVTADRHAVPIHTLNMIRIAPFTPHGCMHDLTTALDLSVNINLMIFWAVSGRNREAWSRCVLRHVISTDMQHFPFALRYKTSVW